MHEARRGYFEVLAVLTELTTLVETKLATPVTTPTNADDASANAATTTHTNLTYDLYAICERGIAAAIAGQHRVVGVVPKREGGGGVDGHAVLGVPADKLLDDAVPYGLKAQLQQHVIPELEARLKERCEMLQAFYRPTSTSTSTSTSTAAAAVSPLSPSLPPSSPSRTRDHPTTSEDAAADAAAAAVNTSPTSATTGTAARTPAATTLPGMVKADLARLKQNQRISEAHLRAHARGELESLSAEGFKKALGQLELVLQGHKLQARRDHDKTTSAWLQSKALATSNKLRLLLLQVMVKTYSPSNVAALRQIRHHLDTAYEQQREHNANVRERLELYNSIGLGFDAIATEYGRVRAEIQKKQWAMDQLRRSGGNSAAATAAVSVAGGRGAAPSRYARP